MFKRYSLHKRSKFQCLSTLMVTRTYELEWAGEADERITGNVSWAKQLTDIPICICQGQARCSIYLSLLINLLSLSRCIH